jgi:hypothetical protein
MDFLISFSPKTAGVIVTLPATHMNANVRRKLSLEPVA